LVPLDALPGLNVPALALVMPVPLQVPPLTSAERLKAGTPEHTGDTGVTFGCGFTVTVPVEVPVQPDTVYATV